jgi:hypothetical protein
MRIIRLAREGSPPPELRPPQAKLPRNYNQIARRRIRQFESDMPSQAVRSPRANSPQFFFSAPASQAMRESISTIEFIFTLHASALAKARVRRLSPPIPPILKKVHSELLTVTDPAVRIRAPGLVPIDEEFRLGDRQGFELGSHADHAGANARHSKTSQGSHEQSCRAVCHDCLLIPFVLLNCHQSRSEPPAVSISSAHSSHFRQLGASSSWAASSVGA